MFKQSKLCLHNFQLFRPFNFLQLKSRATEAEEFQRRRTTIWKTSFHKLKVQAEKCDNCKPIVTYISENLEN